jgi:isocitrate dehydrogenase
VPADRTQIIYTLTDEAPYLATHSFLPIVRTFAAAAGIEVVESDISVANRILGEFPDFLKDDQKVPNTLAELGSKTLQPDANIIKLPNISASQNQLVAAIRELRSKGLMVPEYPENPQTDEEKAIRQRYAKVLGSAVNPVLREGNSDRRAPKAVKEYARKNPHSMAPWSPASRTHVSHMVGGDFYASEKSLTLDKAREVKMELITKSGKTLVLKPKVSLLEGEIIDSMFMSRKALLAFYEKQIQDAKDTEGHDDEGVAPDRLRPLRAHLLQGRLRQARQAVRRAGRERQQRHGEPVRQDRHAAAVAAGRDQARPACLPGEPSGAGHGRLGQGHHQLPLAQ